VKHDLLRTNGSKYFIPVIQFTLVSEEVQSIGDFIEIYNTKRLHQSLGYKTPAEVYLRMDEKQGLKIGEIVS
jgi:transposase InsO family protein